jgi:hypothetical protein
MKAVDVYKYMYVVADKLDFDWSTVLTSGEKARVGRKCYDAPKPGETPDVPAQIVPKTRKFKRTRWHDIVSDVFKDSQYASRTFKDKREIAKLPHRAMTEFQYIPHRSEMSQFTSFRWSRANIPPTQNLDMCIPLQSSPIHGKYTVHPTSYILLLVYE